MFCNLNAEMVREGISIDDLGRVLHKSSRTMRNKMKGRSPFTYEEVLKIRDTFFMGLDLEYLFCKCGKQDGKMNKKF